VQGEKKMILHRNYIKEYYVENGITTVTRLFDPLICWHYENGMGTIGFRGNYSIGFYWQYRVGTWSRIKTRFARIGKLTLFIHYGECEPYNPMTGERY